ncbi:hypothetical protein BDV26DRAFT_267567 [Aspergillus bertholletiae]|uniref:Uncharacterized protein n=1 Tax=Aspergillus bertholletiae TaxID=1226010 RepID=A0A5N7B396_9EURO|nr:hypothetical protein BDV26DRAFT_267567 [Aspergillus bertholletiae]
MWQDRIGLADASQKPCKYFYWSLVVVQTAAVKFPPPGNGREGVYTYGSTSPTGLGLDQQCPSKGFSSNRIYILVFSFGFFFFLTPLRW